MQFQPTALILSSAAQREHFDGVRLDTRPSEPAGARRVRAPRLLRVLVGLLGRPVRRSESRTSRRLAIHH